LDFEQLITVLLITGHWVEAVILAKTRREDTYFAEATNRRTKMIVRQWRGWADRDRAAGYLRYFAMKVQLQLSEVHGYRKALVLTRDEGEETEIVTMTFFDRVEDVKGFAGERYEVANVSLEAQSFLSRYDKTVSHFEIALELGSDAK
jgi:hypothetical protein